MSVRIMSAVWAITLPDSEKLVLLALADCANDEGLCWPSMATLAAKCSKSDRTVQASIKRLVAAGHLTRVETPGKGCRYIVKPTTEAASPPKPLRPEAAAPPKRTTSTPEAASDKPSRTTTSPKASPSPRAPATFACPDGVDPEHWRDLLANRKSKRLTNTPTAYRRLLADLAKLSDDEWPPGRIIEHAAARGWGAIFDPRERNDQRHRHGRAGQGGRSEEHPGGRDCAAFDRVFGGMEG